MTFGTGDRLRALRDVDPHLRALDDDRARRRDLRGHRPLGLVGVHLDDLRVEAGLRQLRDGVLDASGRRRSGRSTSGFPEETSI